MFSKLLSTLVVVSVLSAGVANAASLTSQYENAEGETLAEFQNHNFTYIDRLEIRASQGNGSLDLTDESPLQQHERLAVHFVNDTDKNVQVTLPKFDSTFMVPANTDRVYEFEKSEIGTQNNVDYTVTTLYGPEARYMAQNSELMRIINEKVVIPTFPEETQTAYTPASNAPVRGFW